LKNFLLAPSYIWVYNRFNTSCFWFQP